MLSRANSGRVPRSELSRRVGQGKSARKNLENFPGWHTGMQTASLAQLYSSKTDEELSVLVAERDSLVEEARSVLASEIERRNLAIPPQQAGVGPNPTPALHLAPFAVRAKWVGPVASQYIGSNLRRGNDGRVAIDCDPVVNDSGNEDSFGSYPLLSSSDLGGLGRRLF